MKITMLMLLVLGCATVCPARVKDYTFDVTGTISADDGTPLQDVEVVLQVDTPIYEGIKPVNTQRVVTSKGAFIFRCLSHSRPPSTPSRFAKMVTNPRLFPARLLLMGTSPFD